MSCKLVIGFLLLPLLSGCCYIPKYNPLYKPAKNMTLTILPEYRQYVQQDPKLSPAEKNARLNNAQAYEMLLREYEQK